MKESASDGTRMTALAGLGAVYGSLGRYAEAASALEEARSMAADEGGLHSAVLELELAVVYSRLGRNTEADGLFESSLRKAKQNLGAADARLARPLRVFADHLQRTGRKQRAKDLRRSAKLLQAGSVDARRHTIDIRSLRAEPAEASR
jgi:tetratricopeptide (TPR) repeat protein